MTVSVVIPTLNDNEALSRLVAQLIDRDFEIVIVDGGSDPHPTAAIAAHPDIQVIDAPAGRASQLRAGVAATRHPWIWMVHADSVLTPAVMRRAQSLSTVGWGRFDVRLDDRHPAFRLIETMMNRRSAWTAICTGDQAIICHRHLIDAIGGIPAQPLMEDIELSRRLRRLAAPRIFHEQVITSARRWLRNGIFATVVFMWSLRLKYFFGESAASLAARYYPDRDARRG